MFKEKVNSKKLDLSFDFKITNLEYRALSIDIIKVLRKLDTKDMEKYFSWFMDDLIFFIEKNKVQKRWDFETILLNYLDKLELSKENEKLFINKLKTVTNWDVKIS